LANVKNIEMKAKQVDEVAGKISKAMSVILFDYRGLTVAEDTDLRNEMRKEGVEYTVIKNHIVGRALQQAGFSEEMKEMLIGPSAFAFGYDDAITPARVLKNYVKKVKKCEIKGGLVDGTVMGASEINVFADLPSREVLMSRMLGSMLSPISQLAVALDQIAKKLAEA